MPEKKYKDYIHHFKIVAPLGWLGRELFIAIYFGTGEITPLQQKKLEFFSLLLPALLNVGTGIWLFVEVRKEKANKWIWALFGLVFSLTGVLLYYLVRIYTSLRDKERGRINFPM